MKTLQPVQNTKYQEDDDGPDWNDTVDLIVDEIENQEKRYNLLNRKPVYQVRKNVTNVFFTLMRVLEYVIIITWAFRPSINWDLSYVALRIINSFNSEADFEYQYKVLLWISFCAIVLFCGVCYYCTVQSKHFHFGYVRESRREYLLE